MAKDWTEILKEARANSAGLASAAPDTMRAFSTMVQSANRNDALDKKTKELMATAIAICIRCDGCIAFHVSGAIKHGATRQEITETIEVAIEMGGGPAMVYGGLALEAFDQLSMDSDN